MYIVGVGTGMLYGVQWKNTYIRAIRDKQRVDAHVRSVRLYKNLKIP
jgi:hypothetical protein